MRFLSPPPHISTSIERSFGKVFELFVIAVILFSALLVAAKTYDMPSTVNQVTNVLDWLISAFFLIEITIRFLGEKNKVDFFKSFWNWFDTLIVLVSLLPLENSDTALIARLVRVFRVLRMVHVGMLRPTGAG